MATRKRRHERRNQRQDIRDDSHFSRERSNMNTLPRILRKLTLQPEREVYAYGVRLCRCTPTFMFARAYMHAYACTCSFPSHRALITVKAAGSTLYPSSNVFCLTYNGNVRGVTFALWKISLSLSLSVVVSLSFIFKNTEISFQWIENSLSIYYHTSWN